MASDLDDFVLRYTVELKDSISRLERLQQKMDSVDKGTSKTGGNLKQFASGAAKELDRMIPGLSSMANAVKGLGAEFAVAGAAVGALAVGISSVMALREQMNAQRADSLVTGLSGVRTEDLTRKLSTQGGGYVNREGAASGIKQLLEMANDSYRNPTDIVKQMKLRTIGVNPFDANGQSTSPVEMLSSLAAKLNSVNPDQADALSRGAGLDINWARSLRKTGAAGVQNIGMSAAEVDQYAAGADGVSKLNSAMQEFNNQTNLLKTSLGELTIGPLTSLLKLINGVIGQSTGTVDKQNPGKRYKTEVTPEGQTIQIEDTSPVTPSDASQKKKDQDAANDRAKQMDDAARANVASQNKQAQLMNLFASSVATFSGAVDMHAAWAAWAGNIGQANGIKGASGTSGDFNMTGGGNSNWKNSPHAAFFKAAADKTGADPQMLYAIAKTESGDVNGKYSGTGPAGIMQVSKTNMKRLFPNGDVMDPATNIMAGATVYMENLKRNSGDVYKALGDYVGNSDPNYQTKVAGQYGGSSTGVGQNRDTLMLTQVQNAIAGALGVPVQQLKQGGIGKGDVQYTVDNLEAGYLNSANQAQTRLQNPNGLSQIQIADFKNQLLVAQRGLAAMETYKKQIIDGSNGSTSLTAQRTGATLPATVVNNFTINGAGMDAKTLAREIDERLQHHMQSAINSVTNQEKG